MSNIEQGSTEVHRPRCGNCNHSIQSVTAGTDMVACSLFLEYRCADQLGGCGHHHYRPSVSAGDEVAG